MPYRLQKSGVGWLVVNSDTGRAHSKKPLSRTRAKAQLRALYANVPDARKAAAEDTEAPSSGGGRKPLSRSEAARHASLVRWGKEQPFAARLEQVRQRRKAAKQKKAGKGKAKGKTPEQRQQEKAAQQEQNRAKVFGEFGLAEDAAGALADLAAGKPVSDDGGLVKMGLAERGKDGTLRLTAAGRQVFNAASRGDTGQAKDAASRGRDQQAGREERQAESDKRDKKKAEREKAGGKKKSKKEDKGKEEGGEEEEESPTDEETASETAAEVGLDDDAVEALRTAADEGGADSQKLRDLGLIDEDGEATAEGVAALDALESGSPRRYRAAVRRARARMRREARQNEREKAREEQRTEKERQKKERDAENVEARARRTKYEDMQRAGRESARSSRDAARSKADVDRRVAAETARITAARARKAIDMDDELTALLDDLKSLRDEIEEVAGEGESEVKAGRRNSGSDQTLIDEGYALAEQLCSLFETLGATVEEEEEEVEMVEGKDIGRALSVTIGELEERELIAERMFNIVGSEIKALADGAIGAYAVRFGSEDEPDLSPLRDYFTKSTDFWLDAWDRRPMLYHHAMDEDTSDAPRIGTWVKAEVKDEGVWLEGQLDRSHRYYGAIKELVRRGVLRLSSDSAPHLVRRATKAGGIHEVTRWPLLAASLTPTPAEPRLTAVSFKALLAELGLNDIPDNPEAPQGGSERPDAAQASDDRARRLLLQVRLLQLQE